MKQDDAEATIRMFHEAALRPEVWPDALRQLALTLGATGATGQMVGPNGYAILSSSGYESAVQDFLEGGWQQRNPRMERGLALTKAGIRGFITEYRMLTARELARDPFQQEFAPRHAMDHEAGIVLASHPGSAFVMTVPRGVRRGPYLARELEPMNRLAELLTSATSFALRLKLTTAATMLDTMALGGGALALLTPTGRILHMTPRFEHLLRDRLSMRNGRLHARHPADDGELQALILRCGSWLASFNEPLPPVLLRRSGGSPLVVRCLPVEGSARDFLGLARVVVAVDELTPPNAHGAQQVLRNAFGLAPAEARLAERLGRGESLRDAAEAEGVTFETARTRLKSIFAKTGTSRQAELALLVAKIGAK